ncbi:33 kDa inner dynein arm light chain, axonemal p33 [Takifugu flavidus]|uniref:Axonemal dynein light intermediate polypeptide 1 n=1 Tax=Takifugu flavidus TaxID=433684 RepID=A0A5C6NHI2_9TELE|nr:33 kDa inner dynein arm light chain, axonemal p33 [Takifugu flavidus]
MGTLQSKRPDGYNYDHIISPNNRICNTKCTFLQISSASSQLPQKEKSGPIKESNQQILNTIFPPRQWLEGDKLWMQQVSSAASTKEDVIQLAESLDKKLHQKDELIRQETLNCPERGLLLACVRDELLMNVAAHKTVYEDSLGFDRRENLIAEQGKADLEKRITDLEEENEELKKQLTEQLSKNEATEKKIIASRELEERRYNEKVHALERAIQQIKVLFHFMEKKSQILC